MGFTPNPGQFCIGGNTALRDRERAHVLLLKALETYTLIGMPRHIEMTRKLLDRAASR
jgi:hypothetical protein